MVSTPLDTSEGTSITYVQQYRRCGKAGCAVCTGGSPGHGPYWYAYWRDNGRTRSRYVGKTLPTSMATASSAHRPSDRQARRGTGLRVQTLGGFAVWRSDTPLPVGRWERHRSGTLFKWLLWAPEHRLTRDQAVELLWPEADIDTAMGNLRVLIHRLRRSLGEIPGAEREILHYDGEILALAPDTPSAEWLDAAAFTRAASTALAGRDIPACRSALARYTGEYLPGDPYDEWAVGRREHLRQHHLSLLLHLARLCADAGESAEAERHLRAILSIDPCREEAAELLMELHARQGHRAEAIRVYHHLAGALRRDLDVEPGQATQRLYHLVQQEPAVTPAARLDSPAPLPSHPVQPPLDMPPAHLPFLDREDVLDRLRDALAKAQTGRAHSVLLGGSAGVGKSSVLRDMLQHARQQGMLALLGRAYHQEGQLPYGPLQEALSTYIRVQPRALLAMHAHYYAVLIRLLPELGRLLPDIPAPPPLEPHAERHRLFAALSGLLHDLSATVPIVLALEDIHWADETTIQALHYIQRSARDARLLIVATYRDNEVGSNSPLSHFPDTLQGTPAPLTITLDTLNRAHTGRLVESLLAPHPVHARVGDLVYARTQGNPLFVEEMVTALQVGGHVALHNGVWQLLDVGPLPVPATMRALFADRVQRLSPLARQVVRFCAVLGTNLTYPILRSVLAIDEEMLLDGLEEALQAGLLEEGPSCYTFQHPLLPEAIYQGLPAPRRVQLHRQAGTALEAYYGAQAESHAVELAWHFGQAGQHAEAARYERTAGEQAAMTYALREAITHYQHARAHLARLPDTQQALSHVEEKLGDLYLLDGAYTRAQWQFAQARAQERDTGRIVELWRKESMTWEKRGEHQTALSVLDQARALAQHEPVPPAIEAALEASRGEMLYRTGQLGEAAAAAERALALLSHDPEGPAAAHAHHLLGHIAGDSGHLEQAVEHYRRSLGIWERCGDQQGVAIAWNSLGVAAFDRGNYTLAEQHYRRALAIRERIGDQSGTGISQNNLANLAWKRGDSATAETCYLNNVALWERLGEHQRAAVTWNNLGVLAFDRGDLDQAEEYHRRSLAIRERAGEDVEQGMSWINLADIALVRGHLSTAESSYRRALALLEQAGAQIYAGFAWIGLGDVAGQRGQTTDAVRWHMKARRLGRRAGAPDLEALAAVAQARVYLRDAEPSHRRLAVAAALVERARLLAQEHRLPEAGIQAALLDAEIYLHRHDSARARHAAEEALSRARRQGRRCDEAVARRLIGCGAVAEGTVDEGQASLHAALEMLQEIGATIEVSRILTDLAVVYLRNQTAPDDASTAAALLAQATQLCEHQEALPLLNRIRRLAERIQ